MRSFAIIAGFAAAANAYAYGSYEEKANATSVAAPAYPVTTSAGYPVEEPSSMVGYPTETTEATHPAYTTTEVVKPTSYVCPGETTITYGHSTYTVSSSTTLSIPEHTVTYVPEAPKPTHEAPDEEMSSMSEVPVHPTTAVSVPAVPYPSANGTIPAPPAGTAGPSGSATKSAPPSEFTGAAAQTGVAMLAIFGAVAAFL